MKNPKVDAYLISVKKWRDEFDKLRAIILDCPLTGGLKWGVPCYMFEERNVVLMHGFKDYCALLFIKGALLKDPHGILIRQTENVQTARQIRFGNVQEIIEKEAILPVYIRDAIEIEKSGLRVELKDTTEFAMPEEFQNRLNETPMLKTAFETLTPGRQRAYLLHFSVPKQAKTRVSRIEKCVPQILQGKGLDD